ncbi:Bax inhibitor-1/YccA family protein [bacterium]|nr:Bax inhibitor-1/YccA family protein [bacterium]
MFRGEYAASGDVMTIEGTVNKTFISVMLTIAAAYWSFSDPSFFAPLMWVFAIGGFGIAIAISFKQNWAPFLTPVYAVVEGFFLGTLSLFYAASTSSPQGGFDGGLGLDSSIVFQAVTLTFGTLFALLAAYRSGMIKVTEQFKMMIFAATGGIAIVYLISLVVNLFGGSIPYIHGSGVIGIGFSLFVVGIAALNLVVDFDFIERAAKSRSAPKYMEWFGAFGLLVTLIWLYVEILRLLSKIYSSRD